MIENRFLQGFLAAFAALAIGLVAADIFLIKVGEIDLTHVVERQLAAPNGHILFSSGINQHAHDYKMMLYDRTAPMVLAIGSSRSMEIHSQFFKEPFLTTGGAVSNVAELEVVARHVTASPHPPKLAIVVIDPWWFNDRYAGNRPGYEGSTIPDIVSSDLLMGAARSFHHGNWAARSFSSPYLGIYALLEDEGFARDGTYRNDGTISGEHQSTDIRFAHTFGRIDGEDGRFEKNRHASEDLIRRGCGAIRLLKTKVDHVVMIAPPFAHPVWQRMQKGGYQYVNPAYAELHACTADIPFFNYVDQSRIAGTSDCEFIDGLHPGDVANARMLKQVADADPQARQHVDMAFLDGFLARYAGHAAGISLLEHPGMKEVDFLKIGCAKPVRP